MEASPEEEKPTQGEIQLPKHVKAKAKTVEGDEIKESAEPTEGEEEAEEEEEG